MNPEHKAQALDAWSEMLAEGVMSQKEFDDHVSSLVRFEEKLKGSRSKRSLVKQGDRRSSSTGIIRCKTTHERGSRRQRRQLTKTSSVHSAESRSTTETSTSRQSIDPSNDIREAAVSSFKRTSISMEDVLNAKNCPRERSSSAASQEDQAKPAAIIERRTGASLADSEPTYPGKHGATVRCVRRSVTGLARLESSAVDATDDHGMEENDLPVRSLAELRQLCDEMSHSGVRVKTRSYRGRTYENAFTGSEGSTWLQAKLSVSADTALSIGTSLLQSSLIHRVTDADGNDGIYDPALTAFYSFGEEDESALTSRSVLDEFSDLGLGELSDASSSSSDVDDHVVTGKQLGDSDRSLTSPEISALESDDDAEPVDAALRSRLLVEDRELTRAMSLRQMNLWQRDTLRGKDMAHVRHITLKLDFSDFKTVRRYLEMLADSDSLVHIVNFIVQDEILRGRDRILREEGVGVRLLRCVWQMESGDYVVRVLKPVVKAVLRHTKKGKSTLEIDETRAPQLSEGEIAENRQIIITLVKSFLIELKGTRSDFPPVFENVLQSLYRTLTAVEQHKQSLGLAYSEDAIRLFGAFLLLRFVCPVLVTPERFGLFKGEPPREVRRALVLVSKVLQNVANQSKFEEPYMRFANDFVYNAVPEVMTFVRRLVESERSDAHGSSKSLGADRKKKTRWQRTFGKSSKKNQ